MKLEGQVALVTGSSHGLGLAIARSLASEGASLALVARPSDALADAAAELRASGGRALALPADVTRESEVEAAVRATMEQWGRIDIAVLNAGTWKAGKVHETSEADWDFLLDLNLKGAFLTLKHVAPWLIEQRHGTVVGVCSIGGLVGQPGSAAYAASKWGLRGLLESAALELKPHRVRVTLVYPDAINSDHKPIEPGSPERDKTLEPEDIAALVTFACTAPDYVSLGNATIWSLATGIGITRR
jgi:NAD(P)-dependent dehydrogenase (short-subunit alcohol dehydrogenase family)